MSSQPPAHPAHRNRSAVSGEFITEDQAAAEPDVSVRERILPPPAERLPSLPLSSQEEAELIELVELVQSAEDPSQVVDFVNALLARRG